MRTFLPTRLALLALAAMLVNCQQNETDDLIGRQACTIRSIKDNKSPATTLLSVTTNASRVPTSIAYDGGTFAISYNANGLPNQVVASGGKYSETYVNAFDANKRLELTTVTGTGEFAGRSLAYTYDSEGRLSKVAITTNAPALTIGYRFEYEGKNVTKLYIQEPNKPDELSLEGSSFSGNVPLESLKNAMLPVVANRVRGTGGFQWLPLFADLNSGLLALTQKRYQLAKLAATDTRLVNPNSNGLTAQLTTETRDANNNLVASTVQVIEYVCR